MEQTDTADESDVQLTMTDEACIAVIVSDHLSSSNIVVVHRASC